MRLESSWWKYVGLMLALSLLVGCKASGNRRAPVEDRVGSGYRAPVEDRGEGGRRASTPIAPSKPVPSRSIEKRTTMYVVKKGDTLYSIAFEHGLDYREVAEQNNIQNPSAIKIGQQIRLVEEEQGAVAAAPASAPVVVTKTGPKVAKLPYSEQAVAQIEGAQAEPAVAAPVVATPVVAQPDSSGEKDTGEDALQWAMPAKGKLIAGFAESANRKGIDIAGSKGQPVQASAAGKVVYSGSGLRGYGKLVIIKHNKTYLSAYAHNDKILVKEGQNVQKGQRIAEMGSSDADQVKLHFEIRKFGKPVDPAKYLSLPKS